MEVDEVPVWVTSCPCSAATRLSVMRSLRAVNAAIFNFSDKAAAFAPAADEIIHRM
jgi:hypothetical protein